MRAEENFRYFILTGKRMDQSIAMEQIFALRFACDEEFPALAERAIDEQLSNDEIKRSIKKLAAWLLSRLAIEDFWFI